MFYIMNNKLLETSLLPPPSYPVKKVKGFALFECMYKLGCFMVILKSELIKNIITCIFNVIDICRLTASVLVLTTKQAFFLKKLFLYLKMRRRGLKIS